MAEPGSRLGWLSLGLIAGVGVSAAALAVVFYKVDWSALGAVLARVNLPLLIVPSILVLGNVLTRAARWRVMVLPLHRYRLIRDMLSVYLIGYMANMLLPLKVGEALRPVLLTRRGGARLSAVLPSVVLEKLVDMVAMLLVLGGCLALMEVSGDTLRGGAVFAGVCLVAIVTAWIIHRAGRSDTARARLTGWLPGRLAAFFDEQLALVAQGITVLRNPRTAAWTLYLTVQFWFISFGTMHIYLALLEIQVPWYAPLVVIMVVNLGKAVPSSPGAIGVAHALYVVGLALFGVPRTEALAFAILAHGLGYVVVIAGGMVFLWLEGLTLATLMRADKKEMP